MNDTNTVNCVLLAGGQISPEDPLFIYTDGLPKAVMRLNHIPMVEYVLRALRDSKYIQNIVVIGLKDFQSNIESGRVEFLPDSGNLIDNIYLGIGHFQEFTTQQSHLAFCSADIPAITGSIIDRFIEMCQPLNQAVYYSMVTRSVMERAFPQSGRTYTKLRDLHITGGNIILSKPEILLQNEALIRELVMGRKKAWKLAKAVGLEFLARLISNRLTSVAIELKAEQIIGEPAKIILSPDPELAMDVDNPHQLSLITSHLSTNRSE